MRLRIEGHTDSRGPEAYNETLAYRRADAVKWHVVGQDPRLEGAIDLQSHGERRPIADNQSEAGRQRNRRVEIVAIRP